MPNVTLFGLWPSCSPSLAIRFSLSLPLSFLAVWLSSTDKGGGKGEDKEHEEKEEQEEQEDDRQEQEEVATIASVEVTVADKATNFDG